MPKKVIEKNSKSLVLNLLGLLDSGVNVEVLIIYWLITDQYVPIAFKGTALNALNERITTHEDMEILLCF